MRSMKEQSLARFQEHKMNHALWPLSGPYSDMPTNILIHIDSVYVNPEQHTSFREKFSAFLNTFRHRIARFIVDEAHLILTHDPFRQVMGHLQWIGTLGIQIVLMTATLPPSLEESLRKAVGITSWTIIRSPTPRPSISFNVVYVDDLDTAITERFQDVMSSPDAKMLIFCDTKASAQATATKLGIPHCDGEMAQEQLDKLLHEFRQGKCRAISSTTILGVSLDVTRLTHVIHRDYPYDIISFTQEVGRMGREDPSMRCWSVVYLLRNARKPRRIPQPDRFGCHLLRTSLDQLQSCRRLLIQQFLDGSALPCTLLDGFTHLCDVCQAQTKEVPPRNASLQFPSYLVQYGLGGLSLLPTFPIY
jgi:superfamily II DNA helicase RecQ